MANCDISRAAQSFPTDDLMPKGPTQLASFLRKYSEYDGRGIVIAILDSGVDPALPGLQTTSTGLPKLIECCDLSGAGDVDTSTVRKVDINKSDGNATIIGMTGRRLKIPDKWICPSGNYHLGTLPLYDLCPENLIGRMRNEHKRDLWEPAQKLCVADVLRQIGEHEREVGGESAKLADQLKREDLNCQLEFLREIDQAPDLGPVADCLVWHDGTKWRACIDTSCRGNLCECEVLTNFRDERQYAVLGKKDLLSYCVNIHQEGAVLEVVTPCSSHGSHVASIAAAHHPNDPARSGMAPGAQLVAMNIGDRRLGSMETGQALLRALDKCGEMGVDIVNYSYGELVALPDAGKIIEAIEHLVYEKGVTFVSSAGNEGPAISTTGAPGSASPAVISVAAHLCPSMAQPMYGAVESVEATNYPWSSKGPAPDGLLGVTVTAPGAAVAGVPRYVLRGSEMMNGTSMSSPNVTGSVACLMSAMKACHLTITPLRVLRALENSAVMPEECSEEADSVLNYGAGMIQIEAAFDLLTGSKSSYDSAFPPASLTAILPRVEEAGPSVRESSCSRGVYLRDRHQSIQPRQFSVLVCPRFKRDGPREERVGLQRQLALVTHPSPAPHITHPAVFELRNETRRFQLRVDPTQLERGQIHYNELRAYDITGAGDDWQNTGAGRVLFRIPITVVVPLEVDAAENYTLERELVMEPAKPQRLFVAVPSEATWAQLRVESLESDCITKYVAHTLQLLPETAFNDPLCEKHRNLTLEPGGVEKVFLPVSAGRTLECCLAKEWSNYNRAGRLKIKLDFHGSRPLYTGRIDFDSAEPFHRLDVTNRLRYEEVRPAITFRYLCQPTKPTSEGKIEPLGPRDLFDNGGQVLALRLSYSFKVVKSAEYQFEFPCLANYLYDSPLDCVKLHIFTASKQYLGASSSFPQRYTASLEKGDHEVQVQIRHQSDKLLGKLKNLLLVVRSKLTNTLSLDCYAAPSEALVGEGKKFGKFGLRPGQILPLYFAPIADEKLPKNLSAGSYLEGSLCLGKADQEALRKAVQYPCRYTIVVCGKKSMKPSASLSTVAVRAKKEKRTDEAMVKESVRDCQVQLLAKIADSAYGDTYFEQLVVDYPDHLPFLIAQIRRLSTPNGRQGAGESQRKEVERLCGKILAGARPSEVLQHLGSRIDKSEKDLLLDDEMKRRKDAIVEALLAKASLVADAHLAGSERDVPNIFRKGLHYSESGAAKFVAADDNDGETPSGDEPKADDADASVEKDVEEGEQSDPDAVETNVDVTDGDLEREEKPMSGEEIQHQLEELYLGKAKPTADNVIPTNNPTIGEGRRVSLKELDESFTECMKWIDHGEPRALVLSAKHAVAHGYYGLAVRHLHKLASEKGPSQNLLQVSKAIAELGDQLGWVQVTEKLKNEVITRYRPNYRPF